MTTTVLMTETRSAGASDVHSAGSQYDLTDDLASFYIGKGYATRVGDNPSGVTEGDVARSAAFFSALSAPVAASRSLTKADSGMLLKCTSASAIVLTIPNDAAVVWEGIDAIAAYQCGAGAVSFAAGSGVTLRGTAPTAAQYSTQGIMRVGANEWAYL